MPAVAAVARAVLSSLLRHLNGIEDVHLAEARRRRAANPTLSPQEIGGLDGAVALITGATGGR